MTHVAGRVAGVAVDAVQSILRDIVFAEDAIRPKLTILLLARRLDMEPRAVEMLVLEVVRGAQAERREVVEETIAEGELRRTVFSTTVSNAVGEILATVVRPAIAG